MRKLEEGTKKMEEEERRSQMKDEAKRVVEKSAIAAVANAADQHLLPNSTATQAKPAPSSSFERLYAKAEEQKKKLEEQREQERLREQQKFQEDAKQVLEKTAG